MARQADQRQAAHGQEFEQTHGIFPDINDWNKPCEETEHGCDHSTWQNIHTPDGSFAPRNHSRLPLHLIQAHRAAPTEEISVFFLGYVPARRREDGRCPTSLIKSRAFADRQWPGTRNNSYNGYSMAPAIGRYPEIPPKGLDHEQATLPELQGRRCRHRRR
ncbi:hypothetical protein BN844_2537 [Pseudomonas sp. SHC52]|nr:hypothetical protein BN844_2537 [Pseudomonas sp. SHC52]